MNLIVTLSNIGGELDSRSIQIRKDATPEVRRDAIIQLIVEADWLLDEGDIIKIENAS